MYHAVVPCSRIRPAWFFMMFLLYFCLEISSLGNFFLQLRMVPFSQPTVTIQYIRKLWRWLWTAHVKWLTNVVELLVSQVLKQLKRVFDGNILSIMSYNILSIYDKSICPGSGPTGGALHHFGWEMKQILSCGSSSTVTQPSWESMNHLENRNWINFHVAKKPTIRFSKCTRTQEMSRWLLYVTLLCA